MENKRNDKATENTLQKQCRVAGSLVVDALMMAGIIKDSDGDRATEIAAEEILVRKTIGKL